MIHIISGEPYNCRQYIASIPGELSEYTIEKNIIMPAVKKGTEEKKDTEEKKESTPEQKYWADLVIAYYSISFFGQTKLVIFLGETVDTLPLAELSAPSDNNLIIWTKKDIKGAKKINDIVIKSFNELSPYISDKQGKTIKTNLIKTKHPKLTDNVVEYLIQNLPRDTFGFQTSLNIFHNSPAFGIQTARGLIPSRYDYQVLGLAYFLGNMSEVEEQIEAFERSGFDKDTEKVKAMFNSLLGTFRKLLRVTVTRKRKYEDIAELLLNTSDKQFYRYCNNELKTPPTLRELAGRYAKLVTAKQQQNINYLF